MIPAPVVGFLLLQTTWVVDDSGGPGVDFTDIPPAIAAAADGDLLLVKAGSYSHFALSGKGLRILGEGSNSTFVSSSPTATGTSISAIPAGSTVTIDRMKFSLTAVPILSILGAGTSATLADIAIVPGTMFSSSGPSFAIEGALVHLHRSTVLGPLGPQATTAGPAIRASEGALVHVSSSTIHGQTGGMGVPFTTYGGGWGGTGIWIQSSSGAPTRVWIAGSDVRGGDGGMGFGPNPGGSGGPGIVVQSSYVRVSGEAGSLVSGGDGGWATLGACGAGGPGILSLANSTGWVHGVQVVAGPGCPLVPTTPAVSGTGILLGEPPLPILAASGLLTLSGSITFTLSNAPASAFGVLGLDDRPAHFGIPGPFLGEFLVGPPSLPFLFGQVSPSGEASWTIPLGGLPPSLAHVPFHVQGAALDGGGAWRLSNATVAIFRP